MEYPGDQVGTQIGEILFADYAEANQPPDPGMGVWFWRVAFDVSQGLSVPGAIAKHRAEWRVALGLSPNPKPVPPPGSQVEEPIVVAGTEFFEGGRRWLWKGCTDFLLFKRFLDGEDIGPVIEERRALGANLPRVFGMCENIAHFAPAEYGEGYWSGLIEFVGLLASAGLRVEFVVFADAQIIMPRERDQFAHFDRVVTTLANQPSVFVELANEYPKNGVDPLRFAKPPAVLSSRGSNLGDASPPLPPWDYSTFHLRRDNKMWGDAYGELVVEGFSEGGSSYAGVHQPLVQDEPIGASDADLPFRRSADPRVFYRLGAIFGLRNGGTFHSDNGIVSENFSPTQRACAEAFFRGVTAVEVAF